MMVSELVFFFAYRLCWEYVALEKSARYYHVLQTCTITRLCVTLHVYTDYVLAKVQYQEYHYFPFLTVC
jgi:hypothetical protein